MCTIIEHKEPKKNNCTAWGIYLSGAGLACGACGALCKCEEEREQKRHNNKLRQSNVRRNTKTI